MQLDVTHLFTLDALDFSRSVAEAGPDAGPSSWRNAKAQAADRPLTDDLDGIRAWAGEFGAWDDAEIAAWTLAECNALLLQHIMGDIRTLQDLAPGDGIGDIDWAEAGRLAEAGTASGTLGLGWAAGDREGAAEEAGWVLRDGAWHHPSLGTVDHVNAACNASGVLDDVPCRAVIATLG